MKKNIKTAVILAAGRGTRLGGRTKDLPKGFIKVGDNTLIERSIELLHKNGIDHVIIGVGHRGTAYEEIKEKYGLTIYYNDEYATTESMYTLVCADKHVKDDFLLLESDLLYDEEALTAILACDKIDVILGSGFTHSEDEVYLNALKDGTFRYLTQDVHDRINAYAELVGISKISLPFFKQLIALPEAKHMKYEYGFNALATQRELYVEKVPDLVWCEIDDEHHLKRAKEVIWPKIKK